MPTGKELARALAFICFGLIVIWVWVMASEAQANWIDFFALGVWLVIGIVASAVADGIHK